MDLSPRRLISATMGFTLKGFAHLFYRHEVEWIGQPEGDPWKECKLFVFLNHTSLFEFLFFRTFPSRFIWRCSSQVILPGADKTMNRPLTGRFFKYMTPNTVSISRKRDHTWDHFLDKINEHSVIVILPEGRMMRANGLDSQGQPMTVKGGVADILRLLEGGQIIFAYSGGLHHIQVPGQWRPKLFKKLHMRFESMPLDQYKRLFRTIPDENYKAAVIQDLEERKRRHTPSST